MNEKVVKTDIEWQQVLTPEQYCVLRQKGTERPFTGKYNEIHDAGVFRCAGCGNELFTSETKFDSGSGWPSFYAPISEEKVRLVPDDSQGMRRIEAVCARCNGHLGHVFDDGPQPTGQRYCVNSLSLKLDQQ